MQKDITWKLDNKAAVIDKCFQNIFKNYNVPSGLRITKVLAEAGRPDLLIGFLDATCQIVFCTTDMVQYFEEKDITSKKDYRELQQFVRFRLADAARNLKDLAETTLTNLGCKE